MFLSPQLCCGLRHIMGFGVLVNHGADKVVRLIKLVALLVDFKLRQTHVRNPVRQIFNQQIRRQVDLLFKQDTGEQQAAAQHGNLLFEVALGLQCAIQNTAYLNGALHQLVIIAGGGDQLFT